MSGSLPPAVRMPAELRCFEPAEVIIAALATLLPLPKVELHLHLEGSPRPTTVSELADRYQPGSRFGRVGWERGFWGFRDLTEFVAELRQMLRACVRTADDYERVARECFEDLAAQNVRYAEVSFAPRRPHRPHYVSLADTVAAIERARHQVEARTSLRVGLILGLNRDPLVDDAELAALNTRFVEQAVRLRDGGAAIVGIDLHGDEQLAPRVDPFVGAFRIGGEAGLGLRAHAGEGSGPATVRDSLERLRVRRIAHGTRAVEDPSLVAHLASAGVALDVCPTSNVRTGTVPSLDRLPLRALLDAGVPVTIGSDDPLPFDTSITAELARLRLELGFTLGELEQLTVNAAAHTLLPEPDRATLTATLRDGWRR